MPMRTTRWTNAGFWVLSLTFSSDHDNSISVISAPRVGLWSIVLCCPTGFPQNVLTRRHLCLPRQTLQLPTKVTVQTTSDPAT